MALCMRLLSEEPDGLTVFMPCMFQSCHHAATASAVDNYCQLQAALAAVCRTWHEGSYA